jgi:hypothetical protein
MAAKKKSTKAEDKKVEKKAVKKAEDKKVEKNAVKKAKPTKVSRVGGNDRPKPRKKSKKA